MSQGEKKNSKLVLSDIIPTFSCTVFRTPEGTLPTVSSPKELQTQLSFDPSELEVDFEQVEPAVQLLSATIADNIGEHQSKQFAEQLLHITLDYLHKVVRNITITKQQVVLLLTFHTCTLYTYTVSL